MVVKVADINSKEEETRGQLLALSFRKRCSRFLVEDIV